MSARDEILRSIRAHKPLPLPRPAPYARSINGDLIGRFIENATAANSTLHEVETMADIPSLVLRLTNDKNCILHMPADSEWNTWIWTGFAQVSHAPPGPDDIAISTAAYGIAETGTLVFPSAHGRPASWHFRAGHEIAVICTNNILPTLETVLTKLHDNWPATINFITGPSRTADIEQTLELGAHGPKELTVILVRGLQEDKPVGQA